MNTTEKAIALEAIFRKRWLYCYLGLHWRKYEAKKNGDQRWSPKEDRTISRMHDFMEKMNALAVKIK